MESSKRPVGKTSRRTHQTAVPETAETVNGPRPGFDVVYQQVIDRVEYDRDGSQSPGEAAMAAIGRALDRGVADNGGRFSYQGPLEGQLVEVKVGMVDDQGYRHPGEGAVQLVLARKITRGESTRTAIKYLKTEGKIDASVSPDWLHDRVESYLTDVANAV
jgi:hypothetical protein